MNEAVFLTGGTGFLGTALADELCRTTEYPIYVLVRARDEAAGLHRLKAAWHSHPALCAQAGVRVFPVPGDFTKPGLGLSETDAARLREEIALVFHSGAEVGLQKDGPVLDRINRVGTANMIAFAESLPRLRRFVQISTAYVAGQREGVIPEDGSVGGAYSTLYEKSKAEAEQLVRASSLPYAVCRPGMIVGDSRTGWVRSFNTIYYILKLMLTGRGRIIPADRDMGLNLVPVDYVAQAAAAIGLSPDAAGKTFHLTCPEELQPKAGELADYVCEWAKENLGMDVPRPVFAPLPGLQALGRFYNHRKVQGREKSPLTNLLALLPYFTGGKIFEHANADAAAGPFRLHWRDYIGTLLDFACRRNFMQQTERTVFEQAVVRRDSRRYPVRYYDVAPDGITMVSGSEANRRIRAIADALRAQGVSRGDRIALTGINSVDYMALDHAIGLLGAVSVPIYYTAPMEEVSLLLQRSGAGWFFVGDARIMAHIEELKGDVRTVAFSGGLSVEKPGVTAWDDFLQAAGDPAEEQAPDPDDLATIRYTSGTTGEPKGVMFSYGQLAWMGEVLTNLLPWEDRNRSMRYLSFLPQSHVVEGILASYAPYYMLAEVDFYFLNDFGTLAEALPKVRPTVFFSVPRFYEKLWAQAAEHPVGQKYLAMPEGPAKRALGGVLRRAVLKKAGLDACKQLIVGSAPMSEELLYRFRELGIEIHNAYGQTEAPLITINRMGDNVIPTIGTPLPETTVTAAPDGELIVTGPQVCLGYYGLETDTISGGVLKTGDLGTIGADGHITLHGRKKEMIVTAYGKNISTAKLESRLKDIPGVSEAVLIGENRPYCTALLWLEGECPGLQGRIDAMNAGLSHPEQIRAFRVIETPLSIAAGELTPNLKVKRNKVEARYRAEIEAMYA